MAIQKRDDSENFVSVGEARLWSFVTGEGIPTLLLGGGPGCDDYLGPVAELLADRCRTVRFEPRGCGRSTWDGRYDLSAQLGDVDAVREAFGFERVLLVGHSYGSCLALAYATRFPALVTGVIGITGAKVVDDRSWSALYHERKETVGEDMGGLVFTADEDVNKQGNASWKEYCRRPELFGELARLPVPTVFINAENDIRPNWPTQQLAHLIPNARYAEIAGAGHLIWLTHRAELENELNRAIDFVMEGISEYDAVST